MLLPSVAVGIVHKLLILILFMERGIKETTTPQSFLSEDVINSLKFFPSILAQLEKRSPCDLVIALWGKHLTRCHYNSRHGHMWSIEKENKTQQ